MRNGAGKRKAIDKFVQFLDTELGSSAAADVPAKRAVAEIFIGELKRNLPRRPQPSE